MYLKYMTILNTNYDYLYCFLLIMVIQFIKEGKCTFKLSWCIYFIKMYYIGVLQHTA